MDSSASNVVKILVVDDDSTCLAVVAAVLKKWNYQVATMKDPIEALFILQTEGEFDLVVADVHMPEMNGLQLMEHITTEFHLPVVLMSIDDKDSLVAKGMDFGATVFLSKPVSVGDVRDLWKIVASNKKDQNSNKNTANKTTEITKEGNLTFKTHKLTGKKKLVWTANLQYKFLEAIRIIGLRNAVPKKILNVMDVPGITRENIASHLQKYRIFLKRVTKVTSAIQRNVDWRNGDGRGNNLRLRNNNIGIGGKRIMGMFFTNMINEQRFRAGQTSFWRPPNGAFLSSTLSSNHNNHYRQPLPRHGYGQSTLLSPQRYNLGRYPSIPTNVVNPIYRRNFPPFVIPRNNVVTPPPTMLPQTYDVAITTDESNRNEMVMGVRSPNHMMMSSRAEAHNPFDFDFVFDDEVFNLLLSDDPIENNVLSHDNSHYSYPSSAVTQGGIPLSPLLDTTDNAENQMPQHGYGQSTLLSPQRYNLMRSPSIPTDVVNPTPFVIPGYNVVTPPPTMLPQTYDDATTVIVNDKSNRNEMVIGARPPNHMIMSDRVEASNPFDFDFVFDDEVFNRLLSDDPIENNSYSPFSAVTQGEIPLSPLLDTIDKDENQMPQFADLPRFDQLVEPCDDKDLESVFASMPFTNQAQTPKDDHMSKN